MDFITIFLSTTLVTLPYRILAYYPFRTQLRLPVWKIILLVGSSQFFYCCIYFFLIKCNLPITSLRITDILFAIICFLIFIYSIQANFWKILFIYIFIFDYITIVKGITLFIESHLLAEPNLLYDSVPNALSHFAIFFITAPFMMIFLKRTKERVFHTEAPALWRVIWLLPAFTTIIVMMYTYDLSIENVRQFRFLFSRTLLILGMFGVYYVLLQALESIRKETAIAEQAAHQENLLSFQRMQYSQLSRHMQETRQARHDLTQHLRLINHYINTGSQDALKEYLQHYEQNLPLTTNRFWCQNSAINMLVSYYYEEAKKSDIQFDATLNLPEFLPISEPEFCSMLGNLLENALLACQRSENTKLFIRILAKTEENKILLTVDNTSSHQPIIENGTFRSTKHEGAGLGTASVRTVAERYQGRANFQYKSGVFYASVILNFKK